MKITHIVGARPNFMKVAPVMQQMAKFSHVFDQQLVHTGQHYDSSMSGVFFEDLGIPKPDINLGVGSGSHADQTARVMLALEPVLLNRMPDWVVVYGDVNSTVGAAFVATKLQVSVAHVEAGLRSFDRTMPEEINRVVTDQIADLLFTTENSANENLVREGICQEKCHFVGNVMIDSLVRMFPRTECQRSFVLPGLSGNRYAVATIHRPDNTDRFDRLELILKALSELAREVDVVFPIHPRTRQRIDECDLKVNYPGLHIIGPLGYLDFLCLMRSSSLVVTDSGGIQEETTFLGIPCLTMRPNTERPSTITHGTNRLVHGTSEQIVSAALEAMQLSVRGGQHRLPQYWDGQAAERIVDVFMRQELVGT